VPWAAVINLDLDGDDGGDDDDDGGGSMSPNWATVPL
jgi:hypothetical protein